MADSVNKRESPKYNFVAATPRIKPLTNYLYIKCDGLTGSLRTYRGRVDNAVEGWTPFSFRSSTHNVALDAGNCHC